MNKHELLLPPDVLSCAKKHENEYWWHWRDLNRVADVAEKTGLASAGWRVIFRSPDGASQIYWSQSHTETRWYNELWSQYVRRSWRKARLGWQELFESRTVIDEGRRILTIMQETEDHLIFPHNVIWFVLFFESEPLHNSPSMDLRTSLVSLDRRP